MDQYLWRVPKVLWHQWSQKHRNAGRGYTYATSYCFPWIRPTIIFEHLRMAFIKFATRKNFVPSSKLDTAKVRQRRPSTKAPVPSLRNYGNICITAELIQLLA
jgi:hypothetical protein